MAYKSMASMYDLFMEDAPYDRWVAFTETMFQRKGYKIEHVADLGSGTGEITIRLAKKGYTMIGVDFSEEMLSIAEQKASKEKLAVQWLNQDLRHLDGLGQLDAAVSYCDVINYITDQEEVQNVFSRVSASLKEGGLFLFDVHGMDYVTNELQNKTFADVLEEGAYIWFCIEGDEPGEVYHDLTFFAADGTRYERLEEFHHQRTFLPEEYRSWLENAGFTNIQLYAGFSAKNEPPLEEAKRIFFAAEKGPGKK